jgi:hypothetical protein
LQAFRPDDFHNVMEQRKNSGKYSATPGVMTRAADPGVCMDIDERCEGWARTGECERNAGWMTGAESDNAGACRQACKVCRVCKEGEAACYFENRSKAGYLHLSDEVKAMTGRELPIQF